MAADDQVWMKHKITGGIAPYPPDAVDGWKELGWEPTDERPPFVNPVTAEMPPEMFEPIPGPKQVAAKPTKSTAKADKSEKGSD